MVFISFKSYFALFQGFRATAVSIGISLELWVNSHSSYEVIHTPECVVHKWCGGGTSWEEIDLPLNELFVITGCSRADMRTDAPINFSSCPLHTLSGGAQMLMLLKKMLNLKIPSVISPIPQAFSKWVLVKSQNEELEIWMAPRFVLFILR